MRVTQPLLYKGFFGRSLDEFQRLFNIAWNLEAIKGPSGPLHMFSFQDPDSIRDCKMMSDQDIGGSSTASLEWVPYPSLQSDALLRDPRFQDSAQYRRSRPGFARFSGTISTALPPDLPNVHRTGFAAWRTKDRPPTLFGKSRWDIDPYVYLALRVRSDGRSYFVNIQTDSVVHTDIHQHRLFVKRPGEWETVLIKWVDFVRTNHGYPIEPHTEMLRSCVRTVGVGLTDRVPGPFELCIERIWATRNEAEAGVTPEGQEPPRWKPGQLRDRKGNRVTWGGP